MQPHPHFVTLTGFAESSAPNFDKYGRILAYGSKIAGQGIGCDSSLTLAPADLLSQKRRGRKG